MDDLYAIERTLELLDEYVEEMAVDADSEARLATATMVLQSLRREILHSGK